MAREELVIKQEELRQNSTKKFDKIGRKIIQVNNWYGLPTWRYGWVTSIWPKTRILFVDGCEPDIHSDFSEVLIQADEVIDIIDLDSFRDGVLANTRYGRSVNRKSTY